jgi:hypothetical protein
VVESESAGSAAGDASIGKGKTGAVWEETGTVTAVDWAAVGCAIIPAATEASTGAGQADEAGKAVEASKTVVGADKTVVALGFTWSLHSCGGRFRGSWARGGKT